MFFMRESISIDKKIQGFKTQVRIIVRLIPL